MFKSLARLFAGRTAPAAPSAPAPKARLGVHALEARDCPAVLTASLAHDLHAAHPLPAHGDGPVTTPALMAMARPNPSLNPQPLPP